MAGGCRYAGVIDAKGSVFGLSRERHKQTHRRGRAADIEYILIRDSVMSALKIKKGATSHSAYNLRPNFSDVIERHTLAVWVEKRTATCWARVHRLFSGRGL